MPDHIKDDIEFVTEFSCLLGQFLGHPVCINVKISSLYSMMPKSTQISIYS